MSTSDSRLILLRGVTLCGMKIGDLRGRSKRMNSSGENFFFSKYIEGGKRVQAAPRQRESSLGLFYYV